MKMYELIWRSVTNEGYPDFDIVKGWMINNRILPDEVAENIPNISEQDAEYINSVANRFLADAVEEFLICEVER